MRTNILDVTAQLLELHIPLGGLLQHVFQDFCGTAARWIFGYYVVSVRVGVAPGVNHLGGFGVGR